MTGPDPARFAALLCDWCLDVQPSQQVLVNGPTLAAPLLHALHDALLEREAWPLIRAELPGMPESFLAHAHGSQLDGYPSATAAELTEVDAVLGIQAPSNTRALAGIDPARAARVARARRPLQEQRMTKRWCGTIWPTSALAQQAGMADGDYAAFLERALFLDADDPAAAWAELSFRQGKLVEQLAPAKEIHIEAPGTDLTLTVADRTWINSDGRRNMPSGEVFTGPLEDSAQGTIRFTVPTGPRGVAVHGVELTFKDGEVVEARADEGDEHLQATLATDDGARRLGELGIGTNAGIDRATGTILLDEKMGGTVHLALGRSYPETGGTNDSAVHWDLICDLRDGGEITVDGAELRTG